MLITKLEDCLKIKQMSLLSDYDRETFSLLYQPIVGYTAYSLFLTMWSLSNANPNLELTHHQFFSFMKIDTGKFVDARKLLEATGLLKTFVNQKGNIKTYIYQLFAPKTPNKFFDNTLLYGMLIKELGNDMVEIIKKRYSLVEQENDSVDISASFVEVFHPDYDDEAFQTALVGVKGAIGHEGGWIDSNFSYEKFFDALSKISHISSDSFTKKDMKEIERLATLYGIGEYDSANFVASIYNVEEIKGKRIDFDKLTKLFQDDKKALKNTKTSEDKNPNLISSDTKLASKINLMETLSPKNYLSLLQNGTLPAKSDLYLINNLSKNFKLSNPVINVIVDYVLTTNNNVLSKLYVEKVAASLAREGVTSAVDAMNYFRRVMKKTNKSVNVDKQRPTIEKKKQETSDSEWENLISQLDDGENENGEN